MPFLSLLLLSSEPSLPAPETALKAPVLWEVDEGTTGVLVEDHRAPLVELHVMVPVGSMSAWYQAEHAEEAWQIQLYDPEGSLRARADALATEVELSSSGFSSDLSVSFLARDTDAVVSLVQDILANDAFDKAELKRTGQGRKIGWKSSLKDPIFRLRQAAARLLFATGDSRRVDFEKPARVSRDTAQLAATRDVMVRLPGRAVGLAGDLDQASAEAIAARLLPQPEASPSGNEPTILPLQDRPERVEEPVSNLTQVYVALVREGLTRDDPDVPAFLVANHILGGHFYSRLYVALRHEDGDTYGAGTWGSPEQFPGGYGAWTFTRADNRDAIVEKLRQTLVTFHDEGITEEELASAVGSLQGSMLFERQAPGQVLGTALFELARGLPGGWHDAQVAAAADLSVEEVDAFISTFYDPALFTLLEVVPD